MLVQISFNGSFTTEIPDHLFPRGRYDWQCRKAVEELLPSLLEHYLMTGTGFRIHPSACDSKEHELGRHPEYPDYSPANIGISVPETVSLGPIRDHMLIEEDE